MNLVSLSSLLPPKDSTGMNSHGSGRDSIFLVLTGLMPLDQYVQEGCNAARYVYFSEYPYVRTTWNHSSKPVFFCYRSLCSPSLRKLKIQPLCAREEAGYIFETVSTKDRIQQLNAYEHVKRVFLGVVESKKKSGSDKLKDLDESSV